MPIYNGEPRIGGFEPPENYKSRAAEVQAMIEYYIEYQEGKDFWWQELSDLIFEIGPSNLPSELLEQYEQMQDINTMNPVQLFDKYGYTWFKNLVNQGYHSNDEVIDGVLLGEITLDEVENEYGCRPNDPTDPDKTYEMAQAAKEALETAENHTISKFGYFGLFKEYGYDRFKKKYEQGFFAGSEESQLLASIILGYEELSSFTEKYGTDHELYYAAVRASELYTEYTNRKTKKDSQSLK